MGEVDEPEDAEDEGEPDRAEREVVARDDPVDRGLGDLPPSLDEPQHDRDGDENPAERRQRMTPNRVQDTARVESSTGLRHGKLL